MLNFPLPFGYIGLTFTQKKGTVICGYAKIAYYRDCWHCQIRSLVGFVRVRLPKWQSKEIQMKLLKTKLDETLPDSIISFFDVDYSGQMPCMTSYRSMTSQSILPVVAPAEATVTTAL